jgi:hypothetical protein
LLGLPAAVTYWLACSCNGPWFLFSGFSRWYR